MTTPIKVTLYRWAGHFGPFKVNILAENVHSPKIF